MALGVDVFDSAAYSIFAKKGKYMTTQGTYDFADLEELPCSCPVCATHTKNEVTEEDLARHNLYVTFREIRCIRESIRKGTLWDLVSTRARAHPKLFEAYLAAQKHASFLEKQEPISKKHAFFYTGIDSKKRPEIYRAKKHITRVSGTSRTYNWMGLQVPTGLHITYPFGQCIIPNQHKPHHKTDAKDTVKAILQYQFGTSAKNILPKEPKIEISDKTKRIRRVWDKTTLLGTIRASDGVFLPTFEGAKRLHACLGDKKYCVVVDDAARDFASAGRNIFAKFVIYADKSIRPGDSVFIQDSKETLLSCGTARMNKKEMNDFDCGVAVHVKHHK